MNVEALRAAALAQLSAHADPRGRTALERGEFVAVPSGGTWTTERGEVQGWRVAIGVEPALLAALLDAHGVRDEMVAAVAHAVAAAGDAALVDLVVFWSAARAEVSSGYRGNLAPHDLAAVVGQFLEAEGEPGAAEEASRARFEVREGVVTITPAPGREHAAKVTRAVAALLAGPTGRTVAVRGG